MPSPTVARLEVSPTRLYLGMEEGCSTGQYQLEAFDADGNPVDLETRSIEARVRDWPTPNMAEVQSDGSVRALKAINPNLGEPERWRIGVPAHVTFSVDSFEATAYLTVTPWCPRVTTHGHIRIYMPDEWEGINYADFLDYLHLPEVLEFQYQTLRNLVGATPCELANPAIGRLDAFYLSSCSGSPTPEVLEILYVPSGETGQCEVLGMIGNPITLGLNGLCPDREDGALLAYRPSLHEVGHVFLTESKYSWQVRGGSNIPVSRRPGHTWVEALANLGVVYAGRELERDLSVVGLSPNAEPGMSLLESSGSQRRDHLLSRLKSYESSNDTYQTIGTSPLTGILVTLGDKYGWDMWHRFFRIFRLGHAQDRVWDTVGVLPDEVQFHTIIMAALGAAAGDDLRPYFEAWRFPIDDELYDQIIRNVEAIVMPSGPSN